MKKILILDDDKDNLEILDFILTDSGYDVKLLSCGDEVFDEIEVYQPNLILMDVRLAGLDGRDICRSIKQNQLTSHVPVILVSATIDLAASMDLHGAPNDYITKPYDLDHLLNTVKKYLVTA